MWSSTDHRTAPATTTSSAHAMVVVTTKVVTSITVTDSDGADSPQLPYPSTQPHGGLPWPRSAPIRRTSATTTSRRSRPWARSLSSRSIQDEQQGHGLGGMAPHVGRVRAPPGRVFGVLSRADE